MNPPNESRHCGPYTQIQRQKRRDDVYVMYFEKGMSGLKIAASLGINRNTINEDIKFLTSQITNKLESHDVNMLLAKKLEMMEVQRQRLLENLESANFEQRLRIEKFVFEIDCKITSLFSKITPVEHPVKSKITPTMLSSLIKSMCYSEIIEHPKFAGVESIRRAIFSITGGIFSLSMEAERMLFSQGLELYVQMKSKPAWVSGSFKNYDLLSFAVAKKVISQKEADKILDDLA